MTPRITGFVKSPRSSGRSLTIAASVSAGQAMTNRSYRTSFGKIRRHLPDFSCRWPAEFGARQLRAIFQRVGMTEQMFLFRGFTRLEQLKHLLATRQIDTDFYWRPLEHGRAQGGDPA